MNLRVMEKEDIPLYVAWINDPAFYGDYDPLVQTTKAEMEKKYDSAPPEMRRLFIEKRDGTKIGGVVTFPVGELLEIGYALIPSERGKGYCTEAAMIMVDYLFLSQNIVRIQAHTDVRNKGSQKVLEKTGFKKEGIVRKSLFTRGEWRDYCLYSILREEWKEPRILTKS